MMHEFLGPVNAGYSAMNQLEALKKVTTVVADTGNFKQLALFAPRDATTNPTLILKAVQQPQFCLAGSGFEVDCRHILRQTRQQSRLDQR